MRQSKRAVFSVFGAFATTLLVLLPQAAVAQVVPDLGLIHDELTSGIPPLADSDTVIDQVADTLAPDYGCTKYVTPPDKNGDLLAAAASASCTNAWSVKVKVCIQVRVNGQWKTSACDASSSSNDPSHSEDVIAVCKPGTWTYRAKMRETHSHLGLQEEEGGTPHLAGSSSKRSSNVRFRCHGNL